MSEANYPYKGAVERTPQQHREQTIQSIKTRLALVTEWLIQSFDTLPPDDHLRAIYSGRTFLVDSDRQPILGDDNQQIEMTRYKLWTIAPDFRILEDGRLARLWTDGITPYRELQERGGDDSVVIAIDSDFQDSERYPQRYLTNLNDQLIEISDTFQKRFSPPVNDETTNL